MEGVDTRPVLSLLSGASKNFNDTQKSVKYKRNHKQRRRTSDDSSALEANNNVKGCL